MVLTATKEEVDDLNINRSSSSSLSKILRLAGSKLDKSLDDCIHWAPDFKQKEHDGLRLSHFVRRARQT